MPYDPKKDPHSPYFVRPAGWEGDGVISGQAARERVVAANASDFDVYAKAIHVTVQDGGRATITYLPMRNLDADLVTREVCDGYVSVSAVRRVTAIAGVGGKTVVVSALND